MMFHLFSACFLGLVLSLVPFTAKADIKPYVPGAPGKPAPKQSAKATAKPAVTIRRLIIKKQTYFALNDIARAYGLRLTRTTKGCLMGNDQLSFEFVFNKRGGQYRGTAIHYLFAPFETKSAIWIHEADFRRVIQPLLTKTVLKKRTIRTICIDAGHGGKDNGAQGKILLEKNINLAMALRLRHELQKLGYKVILTRSTDRFLELKERPAAANKNNADLFISIHSNASVNKSVDGIETYCLTPQNTASTSDTKTQSTAYNANSYDRESLRLAYECQRIMVRATNGKDRGVRHARFAVLKDPKCPAVLLELGYLSNRTEERKLAQAKYQDTLAKNLAQAIHRFAGLSTPEKK